MEFGDGMIEFLFHPILVMEYGFLGGLGLMSLASYLWDKYRGDGS